MRFFPDTHKSIEKKITIQTTIQFKLNRVYRTVYFSHVHHVFFTYNIIEYIIICKCLDLFYYKYLWINQSELYSTFLITRQISFKIDPIKSFIVSFMKPLRACLYFDTFMQIIEYCAKINKKKPFFFIKLNQTNRLDIYLLLTWNSNYFHVAFFFASFNTTFYVFWTYTVD